MEHPLHLVEIDEARVLLSLGVCIVPLESALKDQIYGGNLSLEDVLQCLFIDLLDVRSLLGKHLVAGKECFDCVNADGNKVLPGNVA